MDIRERHFGRLSVGASDTGLIFVDVDAFIRRLILFEQVIIQTDRMKEIPSLISAFGAKGFLTLLESGAIKVICDAMTAAQVGQTARLKSTTMRGGPLPLGSYRLVCFGTPGKPSHKSYVSEGLQEAHKAPVSFKEAIRIKSALASNLVDFSVEAGIAGVRDTIQEILIRHPAILETIRHVVLLEARQDIGHEFAFSAEDIGHDGDIRIVTDLADRLGVSAER